MTERSNENFCNSLNSNFEIIEKEITENVGSLIYNEQNQVLLNNIYNKINDYLNNINKNSEKILTCGNDLKGDILKHLQFFEIKIEELLNKISGFTLNQNYEFNKNLFIRLYGNIAFDFINIYDDYTKKLTSEYIEKYNILNEINIDEIKNNKEQTNFFNKIPSFFTRNKNHEYKTISNNSAFNPLQNNYSRKTGGKRNKTMKKCIKKQRKTNKTNKKNVKKLRKTKTRFRR